MTFKRFIAINLITILFPLIALAQSTPPTPSQGSPMINRLKNIGENAGYGQATETSLLDIISSVINAVLGILGIIFIILILIAGYHWMTAHGKEEKVEKAQDTIRMAIIGLIIVVGAFAIWAFVSSYLIGSGTATVTNT